MRRLIIRSHRAEPVRRAAAHLVATAGAVGGLALALLLAAHAVPGLTGRVPLAPAAAEPQPRGGWLARGVAGLDATPLPPLPPLPGRVLAGAHAFPVAAGADYARDHHDYPATDVFAACGTPVLAVAAGRVTETSLVDRWDGATNAGADRGGLSVTVVGDDGVRAYTSHLSAVLVEPGARVRAGEVVGLVGDTGSAAGTGCHVHVGLSPAACGPGDWFTRRGVVSPYPYLSRWQAGRDADPAPEVAAWHRLHGCPTAPTAYP